MSGTKVGGRKARDTNYKRHGEDFYAKIGKKGGMNGTTGGFFGEPERAKLAGQKGGSRSIRGWRLVREVGNMLFYEASDGSGRTMEKVIEEQA